MIHEGMLLCDDCKERIVLSRRPSAKLLLEYVKEGIDRHYCDKCAPKKLQMAGPFADRPRVNMLSRLVNWK